MSGWIESEYVEYKSGYKYQFAADYVFPLPPGFPQSVYWQGEYIEVRGPLVKVIKSYSTDGPSGPTIDTDTFMRGAFEHDPLYQLLRLGVFPPEFREDADKWILERTKRSGMVWFRRWWVYKGLHWFGSKAADPSSKKPILRAY